MPKTTTGTGTKSDPWILKTPPGNSEFQAYLDTEAEQKMIVVQVKSTQLKYHFSAIEDLHQMLRVHGDWVLLGNADEGKPTADGSVEAWARSPENPVGGYYGIKKGLRGRFANYVSPIMEVLGLAELEHLPRNNRIRALAKS